MVVQAICQEHTSILVRVTTKAGRRIGVDCCSEMCWACLLRPSWGGKQESCSHCSEDWSLSLEKPLKELQEPSCRLYLYYCAWNSIHLPYKCRNVKGYIENRWVQFRFCSHLLLSVTFRFPFGLPSHRPKCWHTKAGSEISLHSQGRH